MKTKPQPPKRDDYLDPLTGEVDDAFYDAMEAYIDRIDEWYDFLAQKKKDERP